MGLEMARVDLLYIKRFKDRHGKLRHYFRRRGCKSVALPGLPGSEEFMAAYQKALGQKVTVGEGRTVAGSLSAIIAAYFLSAEYKALAPGTRHNYRLILDRFRAKVHKDGQRYGDKPARLLERKHLKAIMDEMADKPEAAANLLKRLRNVYRFALDRELLTSDPTVGVKPPKHKSAGIRAWSDEDIETFLKAYPEGSRERLAFLLLLHTAQRRSDVVTLGRQHIQGSALRLTQAKTGADLLIPIHPELQRALELLPKTQLTFILTEYGAPFSRAGFTNWFSKAAKTAGLPPQSSPHGLRKAAARKLAEAGCSIHEISSITGHVTLREVERYTKSASQERLAQRAMAKLWGEQ